VRRGQKVNAERKFLPGYVLVRAKLTDEAYHLIKNVAKVTGFLGQNNKADAAAPERGRSHSQSGDRGRRASQAVDHLRNRRTVRVADGPFTSFNGTVEEVDEDRSRLKVAVVHLRPRDAGRIGVSRKSRRS